MIRSLLAGLFLLVARPAAADTGIVAAAISPEAVSNLVATLDRTALQSDVDTYADLLAEDFVITMKAPPEVRPSAMPPPRGKDAYVREMRETVLKYAMRACRTNIESIAPAADGKSADLRCILLQRCEELGTGKICNMSIRQDFRLELRSGKLVIARMTSEILHVTWN